MVYKKPKMLILVDRVVDPDKVEKNLDIILCTARVNRSPECAEEMSG